MRVTRAWLKEKECVVVVVVGVVVLLLLFQRERVDRKTMRQREHARNI